MTSHCRASVIWIFGLPSAGKSTTAIGLKERLRRSGRSCLVLDGDELRGGLCQGLGFTEEDRSENLRRAAEVALLAVHSDIWVVAAMITPLASQRVMIGGILDKVPLRWVWADCPVATCQSRDVKGLYRRQRAGELTGLTGADGVFEPSGPDALRLDAGSLSVAESVECLWNDLFSAQPEPKSMTAAR